MRDSERIARIILKLGKLWCRFPDYRLGQLISNLQGPGVRDVFFMEDDEWEKLIEDQLEGG